MSTIKSPLSDEARKVTGEALQGALVDLVDLSLVGKQAHWNVYGRNFRSLHLQLDEIVDAARLASDTVAERAVAIGVAPDARAATVASGTGLPGVDSGQLTDQKVIELFIDAYAKIIERMRQRIDVTADPDPVSQDILIGITQELEKQYWMWQAELSAG
ncbi:Dps family protein [Phytomonospora endophytica]|uniref:Starvation-inducible DNA-binding protein n=1 Tax=Phytomonospora endophytica TaxID=714109 RepID=A0A841FHH3_9ACTN|nr:DNA starvation/stationary phase protection protein [Phytomonospora endophytica]MBB6035666.1 starvation-inducible DNA-binding protein [Phytomonospora endophytica]GIG69657.1 DNA starvation/stationary phase protection protein [Phytomonospora endophytica]